MKKLNINESFISRIWTEPKYYSSLKSVSGSDIVVLDYGIKNEDSGPDFKDALVKIDGIIYSGSIEIHRSFGDWKTHKHYKNLSYNKVILHVVFFDDEKKDPPHTSKRKNIQTVILSKFLNFSIHDIWKEIINNPSPEFRIPCYGKKLPDKSIIKEWIEMLGKIRLKYRAGRLNDRIRFLSDNNYSVSEKRIWEKVLFEYFGESLGFSKNKEQFLKLSANINLIKTSRFCKDKIDFDSVIFGCSGFLDKVREKTGYVSEIKSRWLSLKPKLKFETMNRSEWTFFRMRPRNFPSLRLAYFSSFAYELVNNNLFKKIITGFSSEKNYYGYITNLLEDIKPSEYWNNHYDFGKESSFKSASIGSSRISESIINVIFPLLHLYSVRFSFPDIKNRLEEIYSSSGKITTNKIITVISEQIGFKPSTIKQSQGIIHLHNYFCIKGNCGECKIGERVFSDTTVSDVLKIIIY